MARFFSKCNTAEQLKKEYHRLAKLHHTDNGAVDDEMMKLINAEYTEMWERLKDIHEDENHNTKSASTENPFRFMNVVNELIKLNIDIELCGTWLWLSGDTYSVREQLKNLGCRWSKGKKKWYWTVEPYKRNTKSISMNDIRFRYGSQILNKSEERKALATH